jgi:hypothetical protein
MMMAEKERVFNILADRWQFDRKNHGSLFDRGRADSYYGRPRSPHWWPEGTGNGTKIEDLTAAERAEYIAGYNHNEESGDRKNWGD